MLSPELQRLKNDALTWQGLMKDKNAHRRMGTAIQCGILSMEHNIRNYLRIGDEVNLGDITVAIDEENKIKIIYNKLGK